MTRPPASRPRATLTPGGEPGVLVAHSAAAAGAQDDPRAAGRAAYRREVAGEALRALRWYAAGVPLPLGVDFGHPRPQSEPADGGAITVDGHQRRVVAPYGPPQPAGVSR